METQNCSCEQTPCQSSENPSAPVVSIGDWMLTLLITSIPFVGLVMLFVWAFGGTTNPSKANYSKAALLFAAVAFVFVLFFCSMIASSCIVLPFIDNF